MSKYLIDGSTLSAIADSIREKNDKVSVLSPLEMPQAILDIEGGGGGGRAVKVVEELDYIVKPNTYIGNGNGVEYVWNGWDSSDFIEVGEYLNIIVHSSAQTSYCAFYNQDKQFVKGAPCAAGDATLAIDDTLGVKYFRYSNTTAAMADFTIKGVRYKIEPLYDEIDLNTDGLYDVSDYANALVNYDSFAHIPKSDQDPSDWERPSDWAPEAIYDDSVEQLFLVYDTDLSIGTVKFACWYATTSAGDLLIERGYVDNTGNFNVESATTQTRNTSFVEDLNDMAHRFTVYRITPISGHITLFVNDRPSTSFHPGMTVSTDYVRLCQPIVEAYGSLPYVTNLAYSSTTRRFNTYYLVRFAVKNLTSLTTCNQMFLESRYLECIDGMETWDTSHVTTFAKMFQTCPRLAYINCQFAITSSCTSMDSLFYGCRSLKRIDTSLWEDTSKVTNMQYLFRECYMLEEVDLRGLKGDSVTAFPYMFNYCYNIREVDLSNFYTPKIPSQTMQTFFMNCYKLQKVDISHISVKATSAQQMFSGCSMVREIHLSSNMDTSTATNMSQMFLNCTSLRVLTGSEYLKGDKCTTFTSMFSGCQSLTRLDLSSLKCVVATTTASMFTTCENLEEIVLPDGFINAPVNSVASMFTYCHKLKRVNLTDWDTSAVTTIKGIFQGCWELENVDEMANWNYNLCKDMSSCLQECNALTYLPPLDGKTFPVCTTIASAFSYMRNLKEVSLTGLSFPAATSLATAFGYNDSLRKIELYDWSVPVATSVASMLVGDYMLEEAYITGWTAPKINAASSFFQNCVNLKVLDCDLDWSKVTSLSNTYSGLTQLEGIENFPLQPKVAMTISSSGLLTADSIVVIFNALPTLTSALKLTLGTVNLAKLTDEQKAIATAKKWTLA